MPLGCCQPLSTGRTSIALPCIFQQMCLSFGLVCGAAVEAGGHVKLAFDLAVVLYGCAEGGYNLRGQVSQVCSRGLHGVVARTTLAFGILEQGLGIDDACRHVLLWQRGPHHRHGVRLVIEAERPTVVRNGLGQGRTRPFDPLHERRGGGQALLQHGLAVLGHTTLFGQELAGSVGCLVRSLGTLVLAATNKPHRASRQLQSLLEGQAAAVQRVELLTCLELHRSQHSSLGLGNARSALNGSVGLSPQRRHCLGLPLPTSVPQRGRRRRQCTPTQLFRLRVVLVPSVPVGMPNVRLGLLVTTNGANGSANSSHCVDKHSRALLFQTVAVHGCWLLIAGTGNAFDLLITVIKSSRTATAD
eukprot:m.484520 g.484520  ORF g.484520 m.484520 type:complete len:359 (+) comp23402_c0_seq1:363-1439(+)